MSIPVRFNVYLDNDIIFKQSLGTISYGNDLSDPLTWFKYYCTRLPEIQTIDYERLGDHYKWINNYNYVEDIHRQFRFSKSEIDNKKIRFDNTSVFNVEYHDTFIMYYLKAPIKSKLKGGIIYK